MNPKSKQPTSGYITLTKKSAEVLLNDIELHFEAFYREKYKRPLQVVRSQIKEYWISTVGPELRKCDFIKNKKDLYKIDHFARKGENEEYNIEIISFRGLFRDFLKKDPTYYENIASGNNLKNIGKHEDNLDIQYTLDYSKLKIQNEIEIKFQEELVSKKWLLFCMQEKNESENRKNYSLRESVIEFYKDQEEVGRDQWKVKLWSTVFNGEVGEYQIQCYEGYFGMRYVNSKHIYLETFKLDLPDTNLRHLRLMLYFGEEKVDEIALGVYYNIRYHGALLAGSAILVCADKYKETYEQLYNGEKITLHTSKDTLDLKFQNSIWPFFERRNLNHLKLPSLKIVQQQDTAKSNLKMLQLLLSDLGKQGSGSEIWLGGQYFFISIPLMYNGIESTFNENKKIALSVINELQKISNKIDNDFYFAAFKKTYFQYKYKTGTAEETIRALERAKFFILIFPNRINNGDDKINSTRISSSITELGYAMALKKPILIFTEDKEADNLPGNIEPLTKLNRCYHLTFSRETIPITFQENDEKLKEFLEIK